MIATRIDQSAESVPMTATGATMKAVVRDVYGSADVLKMREIARPEIGDDEVLVRVRAAGLDRGVWHLMTGRPYLLRIAGFGVRKPKNPQIGADLAGVVEAVGKAVTRFKAGDQVFGVATGSFAEYAAAREDRLALKPANLSFEQAAAVAVSASTALQALRDQGRVQPGRKVLVIGASGGVGSFAVQLARAFGAEVTGVCRTAKVGLVRSLGADHVIDYTRDDFADGRKLYDLVLDIGGYRSLSKLRRALVPNGTLVFVGGEDGGRWIGATVARELRAMAISPFVRQRLRPLIATQRKEDLQLLADLIEAGKLAPVIDRTFPLAEVPQAVRYLAEGHTRGKVVITI